MKCPFCQHHNTQVIDTRLSEGNNSIRRRRRCLACDSRFSTLEVVEMRMPLIIKRTGEKVLFDPAKLYTSISRALHKRPMDRESIENAVAEIETNLYHMGIKEVPSHMIGDMVLGLLAKLDEVAYVRFASVYKSFHDVSEFTQLIASLKKKN
ncbi:MULTISPECIES: transcriptional regulator NrdR [Snodgrassella]|uniref:Transcriptional repressor NrdR n=1 Tax=Snodgrassella alvi TaxID=1196083 RepID=A0A2N9X7A2_9NEIS|nr:MULTISPECIES: transcriptional regulator NrdR [Snodgrassella]MCT6880886.1 transcriptional regulator NrdR [Snodgrassella alvi]MCX8747215.1 transcriptional repressor NrdR [Snodgrassella sp. B3800]MCX8748982.1 transcriptional repressor NrdR [Snodgrassella sp. B3088]MCX8752446.1 transcriptional repressor NrdR [Snodgrassella sp. B3837]PIT37178.1 transcriptional regulator NrdR [Snodgrassella alvi]